MATDQRERWTSRTAFIMAAVGSAVGLGNLWRFPAQAFQNGGGAFFIPYFIALISAGIPLMIVEYALGQKFQGSAPKALAAVTEKFRWVGWFALLVATVICMYYVVVMGYAWHYCAASLTTAWTKPAPVFHWERDQEGVPRVTEIPPERVRLCLLAPNEQSRERKQKAQNKKPPGERLPVLSAEEIAQKNAEEAQKPEQERLRYVPLAENVGNYFTEKCLGGFHPGLWSLNGEVRALRRRAEELMKAAGEQPSPGQGPQSPAAASADELRAKADRLEASLRPHMGARFWGLSPNLVLGALVTWVLIFLIIFRGVRNVGRVVMLTVPLPVVLILVLIVRGLTLPGAAMGILYYLKPDWEMLKNPSVWIHAYGQIFFSLSLGFGILIAYASYMPEESDVTNSAFITSFGNCATSFLAGLAVFSVLGYMAYIHGTKVEDVAGGPGLVFVTYPMALAEMPMAQWLVAAFSLVFFLCLASLGIDSAFSLVEGMVAGLRDAAPRLSKPLVTGLFCLVGFGGSLFICTRSGLMWLDILDNWMSNYGLPLVGLLECIAVGYFFHLDELKDHINRHSEIKVHYWFDAFVKFVTPAILIVLLSQQLLTDIGKAYGDYDKIVPWAVSGVGWGVFCGAFVLALLLGKSWRTLAWAAIGAVLAAGTHIYFRLALPEMDAAELRAPAIMGAVGAVLLFGGLITAIHLARKSRRMAGLALEAASPPPEDEPTTEVEPTEATDAE